jgi:uncharacterized protein YndB with AHSA1/START domain
MNTPQTNQPKFNIVHEFNAPKELVFNAFADADALNEWWGPVESKNTVVRLDFRPGGIFHYKMEFRGNASYGRFIFGKIQPYDLLEFTNAFADANANPVRAPFDVELPLEIFYRLVFIESNGKTTITLTGHPVDASNKELEGFHSIDSSMHQGFGATFNQLSLYLDKIQSNSYN